MDADQAKKNGSSRIADERDGGLCRHRFLRFTDYALPESGFFKIVLVQRQQPGLHKKRDQEWITPKQTHVAP